MPGFLNSIIADARPRPMQSDAALLQHAGVDHAAADSRVENLSYSTRGRPPEQQRRPKVHPPLAIADDQPAPTITEQSTIDPPDMVSTPARTRVDTGNISVAQQDNRDETQTGELTPVERQTHRTVTANTQLMQQTFDGHETMPEPARQIIKAPALATNHPNANQADARALPASEIKAKPSRSGRDDVEPATTLPGDSRSVQTKTTESTSDAWVGGLELGTVPEVPAQAAELDRPRHEQKPAQTIKTFEINQQVTLQEAEQAKEEIPAPTAAVDATSVKDYPDLQQPLSADKEGRAALGSEAAPRVHIGQIDIVVQGDTGHAIPRRSEPPTPGDFSSRYYLRRL